MKTNNNAVKLARLLEFKKTIESNLQDRLTEAAEIRKLISTAKTFVKRAYYDKKFKAVKAKTLALMQEMELIDSLISEVKVDADAID